MSPLELAVILIILFLNLLYQLTDLIAVFLDDLIGKLLDWLDAQGLLVITFD